MYPVMLLPPAADVTSCMELIARDLQRYMPSTTSTVAGEKIKVFDVYHKKEREVHVVLTGIFADGPARDKLTMSMGHNASLGCYWCALPGQKGRTTVDGEGRP